MKPCSCYLYSILSPSHAPVHILTYTQWIYSSTKTKRRQFRGVCICENVNRCKLLFYLAYQAFIIISAPIYLSLLIICILYIIPLSENRKLSHFKAGCANLAFSGILYILLARSVLFFCIPPHELIHLINAWRVPCCTDIYSCFYERIILKIHFMSLLLS